MKLARKLPPEPWIADLLALKRLVLGALLCAVMQAPAYAAQDSQAPVNDSADWEYDTLVPFTEGSFSYYPNTTARLASVSVDEGTCESFGNPCDPVAMAAAREFLTLVYRDLPGHTEVPFFYSARDDADSLFVTSRGEDLTNPGADVINGLYNGVSAAFADGRITYEGVVDTECGPVEYIWDGGLHEQDGFLLVFESELYLSGNCECSTKWGDALGHFSLSATATHSVGFIQSRVSGVWEAVLNLAEPIETSCSAVGSCCAAEDDLDAFPTGEGGLGFIWDSPLWCTRGGGTISPNAPWPPPSGSLPLPPAEPGADSPGELSDPPAGATETGGGATALPGQTPSVGDGEAATGGHTGQSTSDNSLPVPAANDDDDTEVEDPPSAGIPVETDGTTDDDPDDMGDPPEENPPGTVTLTFKATLTAQAQGAGITSSRVQISFNVAEPDSVAGDPGAIPVDEGAGDPQLSIVTNDAGEGSIVADTAVLSSLGITASQASKTIEFEMTPYTGTVAAYDGEVAAEDVLPDALIPYAGSAVVFGGSTYIPVLVPAGAVPDVDGALNGSGATSVQADFCLDVYPLSDPFFGTSGTWGQSYPDQWGIQRVGFTAAKDSAWNQLRPQGDPVVIAVIDSGLDWNHREIDWDILWRNPKEIAANGIDDDGNGFIDDTIGWDFWDNDRKPWDVDGHGTFVAGMLFANPDNGEGISGIARHARLMVLKAMNGFGHSRASSVAKAIKYAADNGADVINLSLGGPGESLILREAIEYAYARDVVLVAAAGNSANPAEEESVAGLEHLLSVASVGPDDKRSIYSNYGLGIDLAAPGDDILSLRARRTDLLKSIPDVAYVDESAIVGEDRRYYRASGTSFAAPMVTGAAALLRANDPSLSAEQVMRMLKQSARDVETPGVDQLTGYGVLDVKAAMRADPRFYVDAIIDSMAGGMRDKQQVLLVTGSIGADRFKRATVSIGRGATPQRWEVVEKHKKPLEGELAAIPATKFSASKVWVIRLEVEHRNGKKREFQFRLDLG